MGGRLDAPPPADHGSFGAPARRGLSISVFVGLPQYLRLLQASRRPQDIDELSLRRFKSVADIANCYPPSRQRHTIGSASRRPSRNKALLLALGYFKLGAPLQ